MTWNDETNTLGAMVERNDQSDSRPREGGRIPGMPGVAAFTLHCDQASAIPVLISVPHAGRVYPRMLLRGMRQAHAAALKLEDRYVDLVSAAVAEATGASLLVAQAPRAMIDLNRAPDDIDWDMVAHGLKDTVGGEGARASPSRRARSGLGLVPRRLPGMGEIWRHRLDARDLESRLAMIHAPYHQALGQALRVLRDRWGAVLLLDMHSMPPLPPRSGMPAPRYVLGDRFGASCDGKIVAGAFAYFAEHGLEAAHNRPYAGGYVLERHARTREGIHALQLEIDRSCYLDAALVEPGEELARTVETLSELVRRLAWRVSDLGQDSAGRSWPLAAE